jgi:hypothetical protein
MTGTSLAAERMQGGPRGRAQAVGLADGLPHNRINMLSHAFWRVSPRQAGAGKCVRHIGSTDLLHGVT